MGSIERNSQEGEAIMADDANNTQAHQQPPQQHARRGVGEEDGYRVVVGLGEEFAGRWGDHVLTDLSTDI